MPKKSKLAKAAEQSIKKSIAKAAARRSFVGAVRKAENAAASELRQLEQQVAKSGGGQNSWGAAFQLHRARATALAYEPSGKRPAVA